MNTRKYSGRQEKKVAKSLNGKKQSNSGATPFFKGDVITEDFLIECKTMVAEKQSISIKKDWITKNQEEAFAMRRPYNAVAFNFGGLTNSENFYIINEKLFKTLIRLLGEEEEHCNQE